MSTYQDEVQEQKEKYIAALPHVSMMLHDENIRIIINLLAGQAADTLLNAGYSGSHDDGGARTQIAILEAFLQGVVYGRSSELPAKFAEIVNNVKAQESPEYKTYLELRKKFKHLD